MRFPLPLILALLFICAPLRAQEDTPLAEKAESTPKALPIGLSVKLDISRRPLKNFLTDETALTPYGNGTESPDDFVGAFSLGSPRARYVPTWDPVACRLVGVLDLKAPDSPYRLLAKGHSPTSKAGGSGRAPSYFGMRLDGGRPECLYTHGSLTVAEMVWLEDDGEIMKQRFSFRKVSNDIQLIFPEDWVSGITASVGTFSGNTLTVPKDNASEITLLYRLAEEASEPVDGKESE